MTGWISGSVPFHGGSSVIPVLDPISSKMIKENYFNLKTQLYYRSANPLEQASTETRHGTCMMKQEHYWLKATSMKL